MVNTVAKDSMLLLSGIEKNTSILKDLFSDDYSIAVTSDPDEAMIIMKRLGGVSVVIVDIEDAPSEIVDFIKDAKADDDIRKTAVIACSDINDRVNLNKAVMNGADDCIVKPFVGGTEKKRVKDVANSYTLMKKLRESDPLTGIYNQHGFSENTRVFLAQHPDTDFLMVRTNIDRFKVLNDLLGLDTGDLVLRTLGSFIKDYVGSTGTCGRIRADHFVMCIPADSFDHTDFYQKVMKVLNDLDINYKISFNLGIYPIDDCNVPVAAMFDRADLALQASKGMYTRHCAVYDSKMREEILSEQEIVSEMNDALSANQFCIFLQPVYSAVGKHLVSAEALVRWKHPTKGMILPSKFIPIFEKNGFIIKLDRFIWEEACIYLDGLRKKGEKMIPISVNVSRVNLYSHDLIDFLKSLLAKYDLEPKMLRLEITETAYTENPDQIIEVLPLLRKEGFTILMDDFGSGYSSLNMLKNIELDILKIDMRFVDDFASSSKAGNLITSIVRMAKWLDLDIIVEGVETKAQYDFLKSIGCDYIQGYYFSKAIPVVQFEELLSSAQPFWKPETQPTYDTPFEGKSIWSTDPKIEFIFDVVGGIGIYELSGGVLSLLMANDSYNDIMRGSAEFVKTNIFDTLCDNDALLLNDSIERALQSGATETLQVRKKLPDGDIITLRVRLKIISQNDYSVMMMFSLSEVLS